MSALLAESTVRCRPKQTTLSESYSSSGITRCSLAVRPRGELRFEWVESRHGGESIAREASLSVPAAALPVLLGALHGGVVERNDPDLAVRAFEAVVEAVACGALSTSMPAVRAFLARHSVPAVERSLG